MADRHVAGDGSTEALPDVEPKEASKGSVDHEEPE